MSIRRTLPPWILGLVVFLNGCTPARFFYFPNQRLYVDPASHNIPYKTVEFPSLNGKRLTAVLFTSSGEPLGTVVHLHGNFGNVSCHWMGSQFLTRYGFDVLVLDYQGYGGSAGTPSPKRIVQDGIAAVRYAQNNLRPSAKGVVLFGQSLGGAVAAVVAAREPFVKAVVLEAAFYSYRSIARDVLTRSIFLWLLYPIYPWFLGTTYDPWKYVARISPRPVFFIHGTGDRVVPHWMSKKLYAKAKDPKRLWLIEGADHLRCHYAKGKEYEEAVAGFFKEALQK